MKLKGEVILDEKTLKKLKEQIREEVIEDIKSNGHYTSEIQDFFSNCKCEKYVGIIKETIDKVIKNTDVEADLTWERDKKEYRQLLTIQNILKI